MRKYYVYVWIRKDTNNVFYVGKGTKNRYKDLSMRNQYFLNIVNKIGMENIEIKIIEDNLTEQEAFDKEIKLIQYYKEQGVKLTNMTSGGEGSSDWYDHLTDEEKEYHKEISKSFLGKHHTAETIEKMSNSAKGRKWDKEHKQMFSELAKGRESAFKGHKHSESSKEKIREKAIGRTSYWKGKTLPKEMKEKMIATQKANAKNRTYPTSKEVIVLNAEGDILNEFKSRSDCIKYYASCDVSISEACIKKYLRNGMPFNSQYERHKEYIGIRFVFKENLKPQSTIESIGNEKNITE